MVKKMGLTVASADTVPASGAVAASAYAVAPAGAAAHR